jgi:hypothetical protein
VNELTQQLVGINVCRKYLYYEKLKLEEFYLMVRSREYESVEVKVTRDEMSKKGKGQWIP